MQSDTLRMIVRVFIPFALGYFLSYLFRVVNAVIAPDLISELDLQADSLGLLTAAYFLSFAAFQIPLGVLLDQYGPRRIESTLLLFAALGAVVFATAESTTGLLVGRLLIGFGVSACLMAAFKAFTEFYDNSKLPLVNGFIMTAGGLGALAGTTPTEIAVQAIGWRGVFFVLAGLSILAAILVFLAVPEPPKKANASTLKQQLSGLKKVFVSPYFWAIAPLTMSSQSAFISLQSLWAGPWHSDVAGLSRSDVAASLFGIALAMVFGFLSIGSLSERLSRRGIPLVAIATCGMAIFVAVQLAIVLGFAVNYPFLWLLFGFFGTSGILMYAVLSQHFPTELAGRVNTTINLMVFVSIFALQSLSGSVINLWQQNADGAYPAAAYQGAFIMFLLLQTLSLIWLLASGRKVFTR